MHTPLEGIKVPSYMSFISILPPFLPLTISFCVLNRLADFLAAELDTENDELIYQSARFEKKPYSYITQCPIILSRSAVMAYLNRSDKKNYGTPRAIPKNCLVFCSTTYMNPSRLKYLIIN